MFVCLCAFLLLLLLSFIVLFQFYAVNCASISFFSPLFSLALFSFVLTSIRLPDICSHLIFHRSSLAVILLLFLSSIRNQFSRTHVSFPIYVIRLNASSNMFYRIWNFMWIYIEISIKTIRYEINIICVLYLSHQQQRQTEKKKKTHIEINQRAKPGKPTLKDIFHGSFLTGQRKTFRIQIFDGS